jgi:hypothetical protein
MISLSVEADLRPLKSFLKITSVKWVRKSQSTIETISMGMRKLMIDPSRRRSSSRESLKR